MKSNHERIIRACTALQVALFEYLDDHVSQGITELAITDCEAELTIALREFRTEIAEGKTTPQK